MKSLLPLSRRLITSRTAAKGHYLLENSNDQLNKTCWIDDRSPTPFPELEEQQETRNGDEVLDNRRLLLGLFYGKHDPLKYYISL
jgi:hypothetical protein